MKQPLIFCLLLLTVRVAAQPNPAATATPFSVFLLGDAGAPIPNGQDPVLNALGAQLKQADSRSALIILGDNIYPSGLPDADDPARPDAQRRLTEQLDLTKYFAGRSFIVPGNHDWAQGRPEGWAKVKNQQTFVDQYLGRDDVYYPKGGCPTPQEINLSPDLTLILLDTEWWLYPWTKPGQAGGRPAGGSSTGGSSTVRDGDDTSDCPVKTLEDMLTAVDEILDRNQGKRIIIAGHHPMYSHGEHGGHFTLKDHLLPLHELGIPVPLPVLGSIYPLYRSLIGSIQDLPNARYRLQRDGLVALIRRHPNVLYVNGHEHTLQHIVHDSVNYITSGSGSKNTPVATKADTRFAASKRGFARLDFFADSVRLILFEGDNQTGRELYRTRLKFRPVRLAGTDTTTDASGRPTLIPNVRYRASPFKAWLLGHNYRDIWTTPLAAPALDFRRAGGGPAHHPAGRWAADPVAALPGGRRTRVRDALD